MNQWMPMLARPGPAKDAKGCETVNGKRLALLTVLLLCALLTGCGKRDSDSAAGAADAPAPLGETELTDVAGRPDESYILEGLRQGLYPAPADGQFRPDEPVTRSEFIVALWRLVGQPEADERKTPSEWADELREAVAWADETGCLDSAVSVGTFDPDELMTRQAAMETLFACNGSVTGVEGMLMAIYDDAFDDSAEIPSGAKRAIYWGFYSVLIREPEPDKIAPSGTVSRGDMAEMLVRYLNKFRNQPPENEQKEESMQ